MKKYILIPFVGMFFWNSAWSQEETQNSLSPSEIKKICVEEAELQELPSLEKDIYISECIEDFNNNSQSDYYENQ